MNNRELAQRCREQANEKSVENTTAILLILAAKELEKQADRLLHMAHWVEQTEANLNEH
jgi:phosphate uptake regulator